VPPSSRWREGSAASNSSSMKLDGQTSQNDPKKVSKISKTTSKTSQHLVKRQGSRQASDSMADIVTISCVFVKLGKRMVPGEAVRDLYGG
jgi:hypothetical protein